MKGFGTGIACRGFTLQNRGENEKKKKREFICNIETLGHNFLFLDDKSHPNAVEGGKRPYHTIIPGLCW